MKEMTIVQCEETTKCNTDLHTGRYLQRNNNNKTFTLVQIRVNGPFRKDIKTRMFQTVKESPQTGTFQMIVDSDNKYAAKLLRKQGRYYALDLNRLVLLKEIPLTK